MDFFFKKKRGILTTGSKFPVPSLRPLTESKPLCRESTAPATSTRSVHKRWAQVAGVLVDIGAGTDGLVWGVNSVGNIYRWIRN